METGTIIGAVIALLFFVGEVTKDDNRSTPTCSENEILRDGACVPSTPITMTCPTGQTLVSGTCMTVVVPSCASSEMLVNGRCVAIVTRPSCPTGQMRVNGRCVTPDTQESCRRNGLTLVNGVCEYTAVNAITLLNSDVYGEHAAVGINVNCEKLVSHSGGQIFLNERDGSDHQLVLQRAINNNGHCASGYNTISKWVDVRNIHSSTTQGTCRNYAMAGSNDVFNHSVQFSGSAGFIRCENSSGELMLSEDSAVFVHATENGRSFDDPLRYFVTQARVDKFRSILVDSTLSNGWILAVAYVDDGLKCGTGEDVGDDVPESRRFTQAEYDILRENCFAADWSVGIPVSISLPSGIDLNDDHCVVVESDDISGICSGSLLKGSSETAGTSLSATSISAAIQLTQKLHDVDSQAAVAIMRATSERPDDPASVGYGYRVNLSNLFNADGSLIVLSSDLTFSATTTALRSVSLPWDSERIGLDVVNGYGVTHTIPIRVYTDTTYRNRGLCDFWCVEQSLSKNFFLVGSSDVLGYGFSFGNFEFGVMENLSSDGDFLGYAKAQRLDNRTFFSRVQVSGLTLEYSLSQVDADVSGLNAYAEVVTFRTHKQWEMRGNTTLSVRYERNELTGEAGVGGQLFPFQKLTQNNLDLNLNLAF